MGMKSKHLSVAGTYTLCNAEFLCGPLTGRTTDGHFLETKP
jgi:hypothetical protein